MRLADEPVTESEKALFKALVNPGSIRDYALELEELVRVSFAMREGMLLKNPTLRGYFKGVIAAIKHASKLIERREDMAHLFLDAFAVGDKREKEAIDAALYQNNLDVIKNIAFCAQMLLEINTISAIAGQARREAHKVEPGTVNHEIERILTSLGQPMPAGYRPGVEYVKRLPPPAPSPSA